MAKKKKKASVKSGMKKLVEEYKDKVLLVLATFLEKEAMTVVEWVKDIAKIKKRVRTLVMVIGLIFAGLFLVALGISKFVVFKIPVLQNGWGEIVVGVVIVLVAYFIKKLS
jgi:formate hydrogenlyase subunit 3/multisubunit Na+/H+ antiporter MnhD subunit